LLWLSLLLLLAAAHKQQLQGPRERKILKTKIEMCGGRMERDAMA
jgi:hypothetical protein